MTRTAVNGLRPMARKVIQVITVRRNYSLLVLFLSGSWLLMFAFLDFDTHHDGYMLAQSVAIRDGLIMHLEISGQYGPISPLTQSWFLSLPFSEAVSLRLWTVVHLALTAFVVADLGRVWPTSSELPKQVFPIAAGAWVLSSDIPAFGYMLPWSSVQGTLLNVLALYLILGAKKWWGTRHKLALLFGLFSGLVIGLAPFTRINVGLALWAVLFFLTVANSRQAFLPWRLLITVCAGVVASALTVFAVLSLTGAFEAFFTQAVINPARWALSAGGTEQWDTVNSIFTIVLALVPSALVSLWAILLYGSRRGWLGPTLLISKLRKKVLLIPIALGALASLLLSNPPVLDYLYSEEISPADLRIIASETTFAAQANLVYFFSFLSVGAWVLRLIVAGRSSGSILEFFQRSELLVILGAFSLANLVQIYPTHDPRHAWWGSALAPLVLIASAWGLFTPTRGILRFLTSALTVQILLVSAVSIANFSYPRFPAPEASSAHGIHLRLDDLVRVNSSVEVIQRLPFRAKALFVVNDGFVAVAKGAYRASSKDFVWWSAPTRDLHVEVSQADFILYQDSAFGDIGKEEFQVLFPDLKVLSCEGDFCLFSRVELG